MADTAADGGEPTSREPLLGRRGRLALGVGILVGVALFASFRIDLRAVAGATARAELSLLLAGAAAALVGLACWGEAIRRLLPPDASAVSAPRGFLVYGTGALVRNVLPLGYATSVVVLGYLYGREAAVSMDRSLAAVSVAEFANAVASTAVAVTGVLLLVVLGPPSPVVRWLALAAAAVVVGGGVGATLLWYRRDAVERAVYAVASKLAGLAGRLGVADRAGPSPEAVEVAIGGYFRSLSTVSARRRQVGVAFGFSLLGWAGLVASLSACGLAIGYRVPLPVAAVVVTVGGYASVLPVPGGLGGYELGVAAGIAVLGGTDVVTALAVTLLFRLCSYWLVVGVGMLASTALSVDVRGLVGAAMAAGERNAGSAER